MRTGNLSVQLTPVHRPRGRRRCGSHGPFGSYAQATYDVRDDFVSRPSGRHGANNFAGRRLLFGRVSAEPAFAARWLPAGPVRRQGGVGLQREHHGNFRAGSKSELRAGRR